MELIFTHDEFTYILYSPGTLLSSSAILSLSPLSFLTLHYLPKASFLAVFSVIQLYMGRQYKCCTILLLIILPP